MSVRKLAAVLALTLASAAAQTPLPGLRIEAVPAGSVIFVRNDYSQPLTACLIELVDYPGSSFVLWRDAYVDDEAAYTEPGMEKRIPVSSMTVGAAPDYVKVRAAIYADGSTAGLADRISLLVDRRHALLDTMRELIQRIEATSDKASLITNLNQWAETLRPTGRVNGMSPAVARQAVARSWVAIIAKSLDTHTPAEVLDLLKRSERRLLESKPPLQ